MKKVLSIILVLILCLTIVGCSNSPLKLLNEVKDRYGNILNQTYYNEETGEYMIKEYSYVLQQGNWVCVAQQTLFYTTEYYEPCPDSYYSSDSGLVYTY